MFLAMRILGTKARKARSFTFEGDHDKYGKEY